MKKLLSFLASILVIALLAGCGGPEDTPAPPGPTGLTSAGSLHNIHLSWTAPSGMDPLGYNIYRGTDGVHFSPLNSTLVTGTTYDDAIASPEGDGIYYYYYVTAVGDAESGASNIVKNMHGTRLAASYASGFTTDPSLSPYVAEGTTTVDGGNLLVSYNTKLYLLENSTVDLAAGLRFYVFAGLLRTAVSSGAAHATLTSHEVGGGSLADGHGFELWFDGAVSYNPADGSGCLIQYTRIENLRGGDLAIDVYMCGIRLYNSYIAANRSDGASYLSIESYAWAWAEISKCRFDKIAPAISCDQTGWPFSMEHNVLRGGLYSFAFLNLAIPGVAPGQIQNNDFDGSKPVALTNMTGGNVPLGKNYWGGGTGDPPLPGVAPTGTTTATCDFGNPAQALHVPPAGAGPDWS